MCTVNVHAHRNAFCIVSVSLGVSVDPTVSFAERDVVFPLCVRVSDVGMIDKVPLRSKRRRVNQDSED